MTRPSRVIGNQSIQTQKPPTLLKMTYTCDVISALSLIFLFSKKPVIGLTVKPSL